MIQVAMFHYQMEGRIETMATKKKAKAAKKKKR